MNLALSDEQVLLREAARGTLARTKTLELARGALDGGELPDLWPTAVEAGWPGLLIDEAHGGAGLDVFDAMLVLEETGRVLAGIPLLGHLPATFLLNGAGDESLAALAAGERRAAYLPVRPPGDVIEDWTVDAERGSARAAAPSASVSGDTATVNGALHWVPDVPGADVLVGIAVGGDGAPVGFAVDASQAGVKVEPVFRYDATRSLGQVTLSDVQARVLKLDADELAAAWYLAQALIAAESLGSVEVALEVSLEYAKDRHTFGRAIGSYQAIKHGLTEVLRQMENTRSLCYYAGWARAGAPDEFALAASAARSAAGHALDYAARENINVHGGIGATWEHDAPLFFRRAQLSRRLLGGTEDATDRVAGELLREAGSAVV
jgi:alkylation response protein AidB-like acyl-CoA dehydrogenase